MPAFHFHHFLKYGSNSLWNASVPLSLCGSLHDVPVNRLLKSEIGNNLKLSHMSPSTSSTAELLSTGDMQHSSASDMLPRSGRDSSSDYEKALFLLKNNPPEQRLGLPMPYSQYLQLEGSWAKFKSENNISEEIRYPSLSYDSLKQIANVVTTQSALHGYTSAALREIINHRFWPPLRIGNYGSARMKEPSPSGSSSKEPDESFTYWRPGFKPQLQVAIECGVSENYNALCRDKDLWIQHMGAKAVMLICLNEKPHYKKPLTEYNVEDKVAEMGKLEQYVAEAMEKNLAQGNYGPIEYRGHIWLGKLDELFVEVWRAEQQNPVRMWAASKIPDSNVRLHGGRDLLLALVPAMQSTASTRFDSFRG
ncbi:hypothetical protein V1509DRAFT_653423 [Lipomyces kononenkoae]